MPAQIECEVRRVTLVSAPARSPQTPSLDASASPHLAVEIACRVPLIAGERLRLPYGIDDAGEPLLIEGVPQFLRVESRPGAVRFIYWMEGVARVDCEGPRP